MTTLRDIRAYGDVERDLVKRFRGELRIIMRQIAAESPEVQRDVLLEAFPALLTPYVGLMAQFATTWAEELFFEAEERQPRTAEAPLPPIDRMVATVRWAAGDLFVEGGDAAGKLAGAGQRYIADAGRTSVILTQSR